MPKLPLLRSGSRFPRAGGALPPGRRQLEELGCRAAPALFDQLTEDGSRSAVAAVRQREWRLEERQRQALRMARNLDADPSVRVRCRLALSILFFGLITSTYADLLPEFDRVLRRPRETHGFDFSAVPLNGL